MPRSCCPSRPVAVPAAPAAVAVGPGPAVRTRTGPAAGTALPSAPARALVTRWLAAARAGSRRVGDSRALWQGRGARREPCGLGGAVGDRCRGPRVRSGLPETWAGFGGPESPARARRNSGGGRGPAPAGPAGRHRGGGTSGSAAGRWAGGLAASSNPPESRMAFQNPLGSRGAAEPAGVGAGGPSRRNSARHRTRRSSPRRP